MSGWGLKDLGDLAEEMHDVMSSSLGNARRVSIDDCFPSSHQPRIYVGRDDLKRLAEEIQEKGFKDPVRVWENDGKFEIFGGERRWQAAQMAGLTEIEVLVEPRPIMVYEQMLSAFADNEMAVPLTDWEKGRYLLRVISEMLALDPARSAVLLVNLYNHQRGRAVRDPFWDDEHGEMVQSVVGVIERMGDTLANFVGNKLPLLRNMPKPLAKALDDGAISLGVARILRQAPAEALPGLVEQAISEHWGIRESQSAISEAKPKKAPSRFNYVPLTRKLAGFDQLPEEAQTVVRSLVDQIIAVFNRR